MSIFKKFFDKIIKTDEKEKENQDALELDKEIFAKDLDYRFAQQFTNSGGFFNYCADEAEALQVLNQIYNVEQISSTYCWDSDLKNFLHVLKANYSEALQQDNDTAFITCEYLIAFDGKIMLSHENIQHYPSYRLPEKIIIIAKISQIVTNLNDAMAKIKRKGNVKNLTSISGSQSHLDNSGRKQNKLFLLLLED